MSASPAAADNHPVQTNLPVVLACIDAAGIGVVLLRVVDRMFESREVQVLTAATGDLDQAAAKMIVRHGREFASELGLESIIAPTSSTDTPVEAIMAAAAEGIDLIAMGSSQLPLSDPEVVDSCAKEVVRRSVVPVLIVPYGHSPFPVDDAQCAALIVTTHRDDWRWISRATALVSLPALSIVAVGWEPTQRDLTRIRETAASTGHVPSGDIEMLLAPAGQGVAHYVRGKVAGSRRVGLVVVPSPSPGSERVSLVGRVASVSDVPVLAVPTAGSA